MASCPFGTYHILRLRSKSHWKFRQPLWDFLTATFSQSVYCLASATLTDSAVKDIQGYFTASVGPQVCITIERQSGSLKISREDLVILFKAPSRPNIFLQVKCSSSQVPPHKYPPVEGARTWGAHGWWPWATSGFPHPCSGGQLPRQPPGLLPQERLAQFSRLVSYSSLKNLQLWKYKPWLSGTFFKSTAETLQIDSFDWNTTMVVLQ